MALLQLCRDRIIVLDDTKSCLILVKRFWETGKISHQQKGRPPVGQFMHECNVTSLNITPQNNTLESVL